MPAPPDAAGRPSRPLILLGPRGSGKTTLGRRLADHADVPFLDLDDLIVRDAGQTIADLFATGGEGHFRDLETAALRTTLARDDIYVLATGGGVVTREANRTLLKASPAVKVLLWADPATLAARVAADPASATTRPSLTHLSPADEMAAVMASRRGWYEEVADVDVDSNAPDADALRDAWRRHGSSAASTRPADAGR